MPFPQSFIDDLRMQADIVQVVQEYVSLKKTGATYKGLCPFHSGKNAVVPRQPRQGVFSLLRLRRGRRRVQVPRAPGKDGVPGCGAASGVEVRRCPFPEPVGGPEARSDAAEREALLKVQERAAEYFQGAAGGAGGHKSAAATARPGHNSRNDQETGSGLRPAGLRRA